MKTRTKTLLLALCAVALTAASVLGTMAYLTAQDSVTNTFTVGKITLGDGLLESGLDEALVNENGQLLDSDGSVDTDGENLAGRVQANRYKLVPNHTYIKDPTVHVKNDSESSYIFVTVANGIQDIEAANGVDGYTNIAAQITANGWTDTGLQDADGNTVYCKTWNKVSEVETTETTDLIVFGSFKVSGSVDNDTLADYSDADIHINAYAVQMDGFSTPADAWNATFGATTD